MKVGDSGGELRGCVTTMKAGGSGGELGAMLQQ